MTTALKRVNPYEVGWRLGRAGRHGPELWVPFDRTTCVIGPRGPARRSTCWCRLCWMHPAVRW